MKASWVLGSDEAREQIGVWFIDRSSHLQDMNEPQIRLRNSASAFKRKGLWSTRTHPFFNALSQGRMNILKELNGEKFLTIDILQSLCDPNLSIFQAIALMIEWIAKI